MGGRTSDGAVLTVMLRVIAISEAHVSVCGLASGTVTQPDGKVVGDGLFGQL